MFDIAHNIDTTVAQHCNQCPKEKPVLSTGMITSVVSFIRAHPDTTESRHSWNREAKRWMHRLGSITPNGLNLMD